MTRKGVDQLGHLFHMPEPSVLRLTSHKSTEPRTPYYLITGNWASRALFFQAQLQRPVVEEGPHCLALGARVYRAVPSVTARLPATEALTSPSAAGASPAA